MRKYNIADIKTRLNLNYILPKDVVVHPGYKINKKTVLIAHLFYEELFNQSISYLKNALYIADIYITTDSLTKKEAILKEFKEDAHKITIIIVQSRGRDISALLVGCRDIISKYDYLCFVHDKK